MLRRIIDASAGTGKTYAVLDEVFAFDAHEVPTRPLAEIAEHFRGSVYLSFSRSAVEELQRRAFAGMERAIRRDHGARAKMLDHLALLQSPRIHTIHSFALELCRLFRYELGLPADMDFGSTTGDENYWEDAAATFVRTHWDEANLRDICVKEPEEGELFTAFRQLADEGKVKQFLRQKGLHLWFLYELGAATGGGAGGGTMPDAATRAAWVAALGEARELGTTREDRARLEELLPQVRAAADLLLRCGVFVERLVRHIGTEHYLPRMYRDGLFDFDALVFLLIRDVLQRLGRDAFHARLAAEGLDFSRLYFDEAQDNDLIQNYLISAFGHEVAGRHDVTVVMVGDIKQSIYGWRNAYPEGFVALKRECEAAGVQPEVLATSWRIGNRALLDRTNALCARLAEAYAGEGWQYQPVQAKPKIAAAGPDGVWENWRIDPKTERMGDDMRARLGQLFARGQNGIIVRSRGAFSKSGMREALQQLGLQPRFRLRTELGDGDDGGLTPESLLPAWRLLRLAIDLHLQEKHGVLPLLLRYTLPGMLLAGKLGLTRSADIVGDIRAWQRELAGLYRGDEGLGIAEAACALADRAQLWRVMCPRGSEGRVRETRRAVLHILAQLHQYEQRSDRPRPHLEAEAGEFISTNVVPYEWYGAPDAAAGDAPAVEVTTIHAAKGLQYDATVVIAHTARLLSHELDGKDEAAAHLLCVRFDQLLTRQPEHTVRFFPYWGGLTHKLVKVGAQLAEDEIGRLHEETRRKAVTQNLNLLYVALTRARRQVVCLSLGNCKRHDDALLPVDRNGETHAAGTAAGVAAAPFAYVELDREQPLLAGTARITSRTVREHCAAEKRQDKPSHVSVRGSVRNRALGNAVHALLQRWMATGETPATPAAGDEVAAAAHEIFQAAVADGTLDAWRKEASAAHNELTLWGVQDGVLLRGSVDTLLCAPGRYRVLEYKTRFRAAGTEQQAHDAKQAAAYQTMLGALAGGAQVESRIIEIGGKNDEETA